MDTTQMFGAKQFCDLYRSCFNELNVSDQAAIRDHSTYQAVQEELPQLILANTEGKVIDEIKKIKNLFARSQESLFLFGQLKSFSAKVENSAKFWGLFDSKIPLSQLDQDGPVRTLMTDRVGYLQVDVEFEVRKKQILLDEDSLKACLNDSHFFDPPKKMAKGSFGVNYIPGLKISEKSRSFYSDKYVETREPNYIEALKSAREECINLAKAGQLIKVHFGITFPTASDPARVNKTPITIRSVESIVSMVCDTMTALVYNEKREGRISSMQEAMAFIETQIQENRLFSDANETLTASGKNLLKACKKAVNEELGDVFASN